MTSAKFQTSSTSPLFTFGIKLTLSSPLLHLFFHDPPRTSLMDGPRQCQNQHWQPGRLRRYYYAEETHGRRSSSGQSLVRSVGPFKWLKREEVGHPPTAATTGNGYRDGHGPGNGNGGSGWKFNRIFSSTRISMSCL